MKQKILSLFLAVVMAVSLLPMSALAAGSIVDSGTCGANGDNLTWTLDDSGTLTISGTGKMKNYVHYSDDAPWRSHEDAIKTVIISDGVTSIGNYAFEYCSSLTSISIPNSVTSIGDHAFEYCSSLTDITIPNSVTSIGDYAFIICQSLTSISIPNSVTSMGKCVFEYCEGLTSASIGNSITSISPGTFCDCPKLMSVSIPNSVTSIGDAAFSYCNSLTDITIPNSVTSIGAGAFYRCNSLVSMDIPNSVTSIGAEAFDGCNSLTCISVNPENPSYSSTDGVLFDKKQSFLIKYPCKKANTTYKIPNSVTSIEDSAFEYCSNLTSVSIPNSVTSIGTAAFEGCSSLADITIPNNVTSIGDVTFEGCSSLVRVSIGNSVTSIGWGAFEGCSSLADITIPNSVTSIGHQAFNLCSSLSNVHYTGSKEQWDKIKIDSYNDPLLNATIHYNQDSIPETYTVTYTDGVDNAEVFKDQVHNDLTAGTKTPAFKGTPSREGYTFRGWSPAVADTVTKSVTYTAQWEQNLYTVTYTDGVDNVEVFKDQVHKDLTNGTKTPAFKGTPSREGYTFKGWSPTVADTVTKSVTYTATWEQNLYSVTYTDGVDNAELFKDQVNKDLTAGTKTPAFKGTPSREGYTFKGWSPAVADTVTKSVTYTAQWEQNLYSVTYTDGVDNAEVFKDQVNQDLTFGAKTPQFNGTPTREGYTFKGWSPAVADTVTKSVTYTAQWEQNTTPPEPPAPVEPPFTDVNPGDWFYKDVSYVFENGIMSGFPGDVFLPNKSTTRGMIVTTLWRMEGEPAADFPLTFADVPAGRWFTKAIQWAAANQIVSGYSPQKFGPNDPITREQMATIFYRYASLKQYDVSGRADLSGFSDVDKLSRWAVTPMSWANSAKLIQGVGGNRLSPTGTATRAQAAAILHRFCEQFK